MTPGLPDLPPPASVAADWRTLEARETGQVPLRCWWARPAASPPRAGVLVLPEVFGVNAWVRAVAGRLAAEGYGALAMPLFARTAPDLELGYGPESLAEGRSHKERTTAEQLLTDLALAAGGLREALAEAGGAPGPATGEPAALGCVGFCFGGHVALLAATLPGIAATCDFYGAGVATGSPGGGPPTLDRLPEVRGRLLVVCGREDPLIPPADVTAIGRALGERHRLLLLDGGHGFMCEAREDFRPDSAAAGWREMVAFLGRELGGGGSSPGRP